MFLKAAKQKLRFNTTTHGKLAAEDLFDLQLEDLDTLAKDLNKQVKESGEESFIKPHTPGNTKVKLQFEIVKKVIEIKLIDIEAAENRAAKKARKEKLLGALADKQNAAVLEMTEDEIKAELAEL